MARPAASIRKTALRSARDTINIYRNITPACAAMFRPASKHDQEMPR
jgi:hypothetical protein